MCRTTIVLDTSSLLHKLSFVQDLANEMSHHSVEILIPQQVIHELDKIKDRQGNTELAKEARKAINWINVVLMNQNVENPVLRGQRRSELLVPGLIGDDAVLDCALYNQRKLRNITLLFSEDRNLCNRAIIDGLETLVASNDITVEQVFDAIADRSMMQMDLDHEPDDTIKHSATNYVVEGPLTDNSNSSMNTIHLIGSETHTQPRQSSVASELSRSVWSKHIKNKSRITETSRSIPKDLPDPILSQDLNTFVIANLKNLVIWHIHQHFDDTELSMLGYKEPVSSLDIGYALKRFAFSFDCHIPVGLVPKFIEVTKANKLNEASISLYIDLILKLASNDLKYRSAIQTYDEHSMTDTDDITTNVNIAK